MSGHSKWAGIKHKKAIVDAKRGKIFTQIANMLSIAAKEGGDDPAMNYKLRLALDKAKAANMPTVNIDRAIKRGTGEGGTVIIEEVRYEGYGPEGVALLIQAATDNKNRTSSEVRSILSKGGGRMAEAGAVAWIFDQKGEIVVEGGGEEIILDAIDSGAEDVEEEDGKLYIYSDISAIKPIQETLEKTGTKIESVDITYKPKNYVKTVSQEKAEKIIGLIEKLEELEDVSSVYANLDIPKDILDKISR